MRLSARRRIPVAPGYGKTKPGLSHKAGLLCAEHAAKTTVLLLGAASRPSAPRQALQRAEARLSQWPGFSMSRLSSSPPCYSGRREGNRRTHRNVSDQSAGARLCGNNSEAAALCSAKRLDTALNKRRVNYYVIQLRSGYCLSHLIHASASAIWSASTFCSCLPS